MLMHFALLVGGFAVLFLGADRLILGSVRLSLRLGITPLIIGLTVAAFGTSTPELFVSLKASASGNGDIAMGNIVGSNIFNIALIVGLAALLRPLSIQSQLIRQDIPVMIAASALFTIATANRQLGRVEGAVLFVFLLAYVALTVYVARRQGEDPLSSEIEHHMPPAKGRLILDLFWVAAGIGLLTLGSNWLIRGAVGIAEALGVSPAIIGLTIVAGGTGLPELATSVLAAIKKESDLAVGNIVGSNIFNLLCIGGLAPLIRPFSFPDIEPTDFWIMIGLAVALLPLSWRRRRIGRRGGILLLGCYGLYLYYLWP